MTTPQTIQVNDRTFDASVFRILELHADYACENSGECCRRNWNILIQPDELEKIKGTMTSSGMDEAAIERNFAQLATSTEPDGTTFAHDDEGHCLFCGGTPGDSRCRMQQTLGHEVLPGVCQSFPRLAIATPAGVYMTLSYTCPTAARLLLKPDGLREAAPRQVYQSRPELLGASFTGDVSAPRFSAGGRPNWTTFDYFWRWTPEFMTSSGLSPAQALYGIGLAVEIIETMGGKAGDLATLIDSLDQIGKAMPGLVQRHGATLKPATELGVVYFDTLLNLLGQTTCFVEELQGLLELMRPEGKTLERAQIANAYDQIVRPSLADFELIERNFVGSRLYANQLAYRSQWLRTGYFINVMSLVALRFCVLSICLREGIAPDQEVWLRAAALADHLLQHQSGVQRKFLELVEKNIQAPATPMSDLYLPAMF